MIEHLDLTCDVPFVAKFDAPFVGTTIRFNTEMPNCNLPPGPVVSVHGIVHSSRDPNELSGPLGYGTPRFVAPVGVLPYFVSFENDGGIAAQTVSVTEQLDPNLDWSTFQLGDFGFGPIHVSVRAGLAQYQTSVSYQNSDGSPLNVQVALKFNVQTGRLTADFTSLDPTTGQAPRGVFDGFLLPDNATHVGEGYIEYSARPKAGLSTGTQIRGTASITFDQNSPIATDQVDPHDPSKGTDPSKEAPVTIDSGAPSSQVLTLPAVQAGLGFPVSWNGTDDVGGSGIASYTIYVSDNKGAFTPWLVNTSTTSATYTGKSGHLYSFSSVATDNVGNVESTPLHAEATTTVRNVKVEGDFNGDGLTDVGIYQPNTGLFALATLTPGKYAIGSQFFPKLTSQPGDNGAPITGDFNGDGLTDIGLYFPSQDLFELGLLNAQGQITKEVDINYGYHVGTNAIPVTGDWAGSGITGIGVYLPDKDLFALGVLDSQVKVA